MTAIVDLLANLLLVEVMLHLLLVLQLLDTVLQVPHVHVLELIAELLTQSILVKLTDIIHYLLFKPPTLLVLNRHRLSSALF